MSISYRVEIIIQQEKEKIYMESLNFCASTGNLRESSSFPLYTHVCMYIWQTRATCPSHWLEGPKKIKYDNFLMI